MYKINIVFFTALLLLTACQKEGVFREQLQYTDVTVSWAYNPNPGKPFAIELNGSLLTDSLIYNDPDRNSIMKRFALESNSARLVVKEGAEKLVILDTQVSVAGKTALRLLQLQPGGQPVVTTGTEEAEPDPESRDMTKLQLIYMHPRLPDSIFVDIFAFNMATWELDTPYMQRYLLKRGTFSEYKSFRFIYGMDMGFFMDIRDAATGDIIQGYDLNNFWGFVNSIFNYSGRPEPSAKLVTAIIDWGEEDNPNAPDMAYDYQLYFQNW